MKDLLTYITEKIKIEIEVSSKEKNDVRKAIYKELQKNNTTGKFYKDTNWQGVINVQKDVQNALDWMFRKYHHEYEVSIYPENGGYKKNNDGTQWKEYKVDLFIKGQEEPFMSGILNCHAAGRMDDPFGMYDMSFMLN